MATSSKATGSKANEGANDGSDDDSNWVPTKKVKQAAKKKVASKTASTQEEKAGLRRIRERRNEHVNLLAKQLQEEANSEDADDHAAGNADSLKDAKQLLLQEDADVQGSDDADSDASLNNGDASDGEGGGFGSGGLSTRVNAIDQAAAEADAKERAAVVFTPDDNDAEAAAPEPSRSVLAAQGEALKCLSDACHCRSTYGIMFEYGPKIQACTTVGAVCDLLDEALATLPAKTGGGASGKPAPEPAFEKGQHVKYRGSVAMVLHVHKRDNLTPHYVVALPNGEQHHTKENDLSSADDLRLSDVAFTWQALGSTDSAGMPPRQE